MARARTKADLTPDPHGGSEYGGAAGLVQGEPHKPVAHETLSELYRTDTLDAESGTDLSGRV